MLVIRLLRVGKKNQPAFKIVVVDKRRSSKSGRFLEEVGFYNPLTKEKVLKTDRIKYWLSKGVQPSPTVHNLLVKEKILEGKKKPVHKKAKKKEPSAAPLEAPAGKEKPEEKKPVAEAKPKAKTEEKPPEKTSEEKPTEKKETEVPPKVEPPKESSFAKAIEDKGKPEDKKE